MNFYDLISDIAEEKVGRITGVAVGVVTNNQDPDGLGRVKVRFPWLSDADESQWARIAAPMAGKDRGVYFLPEVDDEVLVAFEHGDPRFPCVIGALWNGKDAPPATNSDGKNNVRVIKSRSGHIIRLNDEDGKEMIEIIDKSEKNSIIFAVTPDGKIAYGGKEIGLGGVRPIVKRLCAKEPLPVVIQADENSRSGMLIRVIDEAKLGGAKDVSLATEKG